MSTTATETPTDSNEEAPPATSPRVGGWIGIKYRVRYRMRQYAAKRAWNWDSINRIGQSKVLKSSYLFLGVVPVIAKAVEKFPAEMVMIIYGQQVVIPVGLPFSWVALFFCAVAVSAGNIIYELRSPLLVRMFRDYSEYQASARGGRYLSRHIRLMFPEVDRVGGDALLERLSKRYKESYSETELRSMSREIAETSVAGPALTAKTFYFIRDIGNHEKLWSRFAATVAYVLGFILFGVIALQNIWFVLKYLASRWLN